jgi:tRNA uridine 5-carboxymethylaminomethyl modification enzyme
MLFAAEWRKMLEETPNVDFWQEMATGIVVKSGKIRGVKTGMGLEIPCKSVVLTNGTFLNGVIHIGEKNFGGGRAGEKAAHGITEQLIQLGFESGRMKTGTPPRVDGRSLDYSKMEEQKGDESPGKFSFLQDIKPIEKQRSCYITYTNQDVHDILRTGFHQSPMFAGRIKGTGPRYCPSVEDKIDRFADKERHQIFVEPEGWNTIEIYVNGFSTSLSEDVQYKAIRKIPGFESVKLFRPGYAIEYDYFPPTQLEPSLETKLVKNLFFAGQINGTTGYEEAASQGLMAGINAHLAVLEFPPFILKRSDAYIGVLVDDLINKGTEEPYRMFTSRAEYRVLLRQDNADLRLTPVSYELGLASDLRMSRVEHKKLAVENIIAHFKRESISPDNINSLLEKLGTAPIQQKMKLVNILLRPQIEIADLQSFMPELNSFLQQFDAECIEQASIQIKYEGYVEKEQLMVDKMNKLEDFAINDDFDYERVKSLSAEARQKLKKVRPRTLGQATRISGVSPADISVLMVYMGR